MFWLYLSIFAYLLFALANIGDKLVVSKYKTEPIAYAFYIGVLGATAVFLIPFKVKIISLNLTVLAFLAGLTFILAAYFMYKSLEQGEASRAITIMGSSSPIFTFILSVFILEERLRINELIAFALLVGAIFLLSWHKEKERSQFHLKLVVWALLAGLFFSFNYILTKYLFIREDFITIFFWTRIGGVLTALFLFLLPLSRKMILKDWQKPKKQKGVLVLAIQIAGGLGVLSQSYALKLASATLVNALQAIQYALVFILALFLGKRIPVLREKIDKHHLISKIAALSLVAIGLYFITLK